MSAGNVLILMAVLFLVFGYMGVPVSFALMAGVFASTAFTQVSLQSMVGPLFHGIDSETLLAVPFFLRVGELMASSDVVHKMIRLSQTLVGHLRGGLAQVVTLFSMFFAGISGSSTADVAILARTVAPEMDKEGYDRAFTAALIASASTMANLIPPSIMAVVYGATGNVSIGGLLQEPHRRGLHLSALSASPQNPAMLTFEPLTPRLGARVHGVELARSVSDTEFAAIFEAFLRYQVLLFPPQDLPPAAQVALGRCFGELQVHVMAQYHADGHPELYRLSNLDETGQPNGKHPDKGTLAWHTDGSWSRVTGQATIIYGELVPTVGGETHFCDMYGAYERLSAAWKARIAPLRALHNLDFSRTRRHGVDLMTEAQRLDKPPVDQPIVRTHPETGRQCLYLGDPAESIVGMPYGKGRALIDELNALAIHPELCYEHHWQAGELLLWDNRCLLHRATAFDVERHGRVVRRCTVLGEVPY